MDDKLHWWCDRAWLYVVYLEGVVMLCALPIGLASWDTPKIIGCLLVIFLAAHVFEENTWPAGFFYQNNLGVGSEDPMVYPQNMLTNIITNLGLLTLISVFVLTGIVPDAMLVTLAGMFGVGECIVASQRDARVFVDPRQADAVDRPADLTREPLAHRCRTGFPEPGPPDFLRNGIR